MNYDQLQLTYTLHCSSHRQQCRSRLIMHLWCPASTLTGAVPKVQIPGQRIRSFIVDPLVPSEDRYGGLAHTTLISDKYSVVGGWGINILNPAKIRSKPEGMDMKEMVCGESCDFFLTLSLPTFVLNSTHTHTYTQTPPSYCDQTDVCC